jgi:hypothetical protein
MPKLTDTYARAYDCCDTIFIELGRFPTIDLIRERIGVNSPATIKKAMNEWTQHFAEKHFDKVNRPDIPVALTNAMDQAWKLAVVEAEKAYLGKAQVYLNRLSETEGEIAALAQEKGFLAATLAEARLHLGQGEEKVALLQRQVEEQGRINAELSGQVTDNAKKLAEQQVQFKEQEQRWQKQQEQDQAWFARRIVEEKQFMEEKWRDQVQRLKQQAAALNESETSLRGICAGLRQENQRLAVALVEAQKAKPGGHKFKPRLQGKNKA